jgi:YVTN family beta-propeller protein
MRSLKISSVLLAMSLLWASGCGEDEEAQPPAGNNGGQCSAETPVCDAACGAGQVCAFNADSSTCGCIDFCDSNNPVCEGGCGANQFCAVGCVCTDIVCQADAPVCNPGCGVGQVCNATCACEAAPEPPPANLLPRPSRSTAVDISPNDAVVAMVNTDDGSVSFFNATPGQEGRVAKVASSAQGKSEPMSVIIHPDGKRAFVANRATGTVRVINGIDTTTPTPGQEAQVGSEPVGLALTPTGATLYVTDWVGGEVVALNTNDLSVTARIKTPGNPFALAITNDGDNEDSDEKVLVTRFFAAARGAEATDDGRRGEVYVIDVGATALNRTIELAPLAQCFTGAIADQMVTSGCFPNQLNGITIHTAFGKTYAYVTSVAASPAGPVSFNHNVQALVSVIDVDGEVELPALTQNLNALIKDQQPDTDGDDSIGRRFLNVPNAIAFVARDDVAIGYVTAAGSDVVLRVEYSAEGQATVGAPSAFNIAVGQNPQGIVVRHRTGASAAYVANLISRDLTILSFRDQRALGQVTSTPQPSDPSSAEFKAWKGKRFFNTGDRDLVEGGLGELPGLPPHGPHRQRDLELRRRPAPDHRPRRPVREPTTPRTCAPSTGPPSSTRPRTSSSTPAASRAAAAPSGTTRAP